MAGDPAWLAIAAAFLALALVNIRSLNRSARIEDYLRRICERLEADAAKRAAYEKAVAQFEGVEDPAQYSFYVDGTIVQVRGREGAWVATSASWPKLLQIEAANLTTLGQLVRRVARYEKPR